ncbi:MAG: hypothetical protein GY861_02955 [bacterium]|nr:hypothetical protein [bacterium]
MEPLGNASKVEGELSYYEIPENMKYVVINTKSREITLEEPELIPEDELEEEVVEE